MSTRSHLPTYTGEPTRSRVRGRVVESSQVIGKQADRWGQKLREAIAHGYVAVAENDYVVLLQRFE